MLKLQGFDPSLLQLSELSARQWGHLIGNSMSVNVLERLLLRLLPLAGLAPRNAASRWESSIVARQTVANFGQE